ncbi:MAG: hypothetical protein LBL33_10810 [Tannerella sp.]|jgi:hypothetical protein|nr:hypothetical protein [Tannerella sp.]
MYKTKEFEQATLQKGYELERIHYTNQNRVHHAKGFVPTKSGKKTVIWTNDGRAIVENDYTPEYNLFEKPEKDGTLE